MSHDHHHDHHHHNQELQTVSNALIMGIALNGLFVITEIVAGFYSNSLSLLSDAGHNLGDVASLCVSLFAWRLTKVKPNSRYTYGFKKATVLASLLNAAILLIAVGSIGWEAIQRILHPEPIQGKIVAIVAGVGIIINGLSAYLFYRNKDTDLNMKGAYLHLLADALVSLGVVVGGVVLYYTGWQWLDPIVGLMVIAAIVVSSWRLLAESLRMSLDGVPYNIDLEKIKNSATRIPGIKGIHHIHVWAMSTTKNALTAHLIVDEHLDEKELQVAKKEFRHQLEHLNIGHATLETDLENNMADDCD
jgi:cobalt-zinc-cadmium efflux system protein